VWLKEIVQYDEQFRLRKAHYPTSSCGVVDQYSYDFVVFCCVGPLALPKKDKIDLWHLAVSGLFALQVGPFALIIKNDQVPKIYFILFWQRQRPHTAKNNKIIRILNVLFI
jgi:hypothetical protein